MLQQSLCFFFLYSVAEFFATFSRTDTSGRTRVVRRRICQARFEKVQELLEEISFCQERWALLDETFSTKKKKVSEVAAFQKLDSNWKAAAAIL